MAFLKRMTTLLLAFASLLSSAQENETLPETKFQCHRSFSYRGQNLPCDSSLNTDAEALKPILERSPEALSDLESYQKNQKRIQTLAYVGTLGVILFASNVIFSNSSERTEEKKNVDSIIRYTGLGITLGSTLFGISFLRNNEQNLFNAVDTYNKQFPKDQIQLNFKYDF